MTADEFFLLLDYLTFVGFVALFSVRMVRLRLHHFVPLVLLIAGVGLMSETGSLVKAKLFVLAIWGLFEIAHRWGVRRADERR